MMLGIDWWNNLVSVAHSPYRAIGFRGPPFAAVNFRTCEDYDYATLGNIASGWQWRGADTNYRFRVGLQCYDGPRLLCEKCVVSEFWKQRSAWLIVILRHKGFP